MNDDLRNNPPLLCYVDESGDPGLGEKSSPWFFLSACIVRADEASNVASYIDEAKYELWERLNRQPKKFLDWKNLTHPVRGAILPIFTARNYTQIVVGMWKQHISRPRGIAVANTLYLYTCRYLLERVSWYARDNGGFVRITFSKTHRLDLPALKDYLHRIMGDPNCSIAPVFDIDSIRTSSLKKVGLLTLADNAASAFAAGFNPDTYGLTYAHHVVPIVPHLYRVGRRGIWSYGLKVMPQDVNMQMVKDEYPFTEDWF